MGRVGIAELKAAPGKYLAPARAGETTIAGHDRSAARLVPAPVPGTRPATEGRAGFAGEP